MSMTDKVGAAAGLGVGSMSLPLRGLLDGPGTSSRSGVKTLLPLLVLGDCSVGLKLTGDRNPCTWVLRARGKVFLPAERGTGVTQRKLNHCRGCVWEQTVAVVLKAKRNPVSPRVCASFPRLLKDGVVVLYEGRKKNERRNHSNKKSQNS